MIMAGTKDADSLLPPIGDIFFILNKRQNRKQWASDLQNNRKPNSGSPESFSIYGTLFS